MASMEPTIRGAVAAAVLLLATAWAPAGAAEPIRLGFSGAHALPDEVWDGMDDEGRAAFLEARFQLAADLGARILRLGSTRPVLVGTEQIQGGENRNWRRVDAAVGALVASGVEVCLTLPEHPEESGLWEDFVHSVAERYDGDTDFGVEKADRNHEFPNIDGSPHITPSDWDADEEDLQAWADAHRVSILELGDEPRRAEQTNQLAEGEYGTLLKAGRAGVDEAGSEQRVMLAGVAIEGQPKDHFTKRLAGLGEDQRPWFDLANVHVLGRTDDLTQLQAVVQIRKLGDWLTSVGHGDAERWVGDLALGSAPNAGPCTDPRCSERTQAAGIVRLVMESVAAGVATVLYGEPIEILGAGDGGGEREGTGLLTLELQGEIAPSQLPVRPRPAWAVWRRLGDLLGDRDTGEINPMSGLPENVRGFRVGEDGWVLWYDWSRVTAEAYDGEITQVTLEGLDVASLRVVSLWPESVGAEIGEHGDVEVVWSDDVVPVDQEGAATLFLDQDPVWIEVAEASTSPGEDAGSADTIGADAAGGTDAGSGAGGGGGGGGCAGADGDGPALPWWALALGLLGWWLRRGALRA